MGNRGVGGFLPTRSVFGFGVCVWDLDGPAVVDNIGVGGALLTRRRGRVRMGFRGVGLCFRVWGAGWVQEGRSTGVVQGFDSPEEGGVNKKG